MVFFQNTFLKISFRLQLLCNLFDTSLLVCMVRHPRNSAYKQHIGYTMELGRIDLPIQLQEYLGPASNLYHSSTVVQHHWQFSKAHCIIGIFLHFFKNDDVIKTSLKFCNIPLISYTTRHLYETFDLHG